MLGDWKIILPAMFHDEQKDVHKLAPQDEVLYRNSKTKHHIVLKKDVKDAKMVGWNAYHVESGKHLSSAQSRGRTLADAIESFEKNVEPKKVEVKMDTKVVKSMLVEKLLEKMAKRVERMTNNVDKIQAATQSTDSASMLDEKTRGDCNTGKIIERVREIKKSSIDDEASKLGKKKTNY